VNCRFDTTLIFTIKIAIKNLQQNVAFVTNYEPINLTQKPGVTTFYQYMSDLANKKLKTKLSRDCGMY